MLIVTTNKSNPLPIDTRTGDRRYLVCKATDVYLGKSSDFWTKLNSLFRQQEFIGSLYQYLNNLNVDNIDWKTKRKKFLGDSYKAMVQYCIPTEVLYFMHLLCLYENCVQELPVPINRRFPNIERAGAYRYTRKALYDDAKSWANDEARTNVELQVFKSSLQNYGKTGFHIKTAPMYNGHKTVSIDFTDVKRALVDRKYIDGPTDGVAARCTDEDENLDYLDFKISK